MAEYMRDRMVYKVFHSTDEDAVEQLMEAYDKAFEGHPDSDGVSREDVMKTAENTVAAVRDNHGWFVIAPSGRVELRSPIDIASGWEEVSGDVWADVLAERQRQLEKGYTLEHDDAEGGDHLLQVASSYLSLPESALGLPLESTEVRRRVIKAMATLLATVEFIDRAEKSALVGQLDVETEIEEIEQAIQDRPDDQLDHGGWEDR